MSQPLNIENEEVRRDIVSLPDSSFRFELFKLLPLTDNIHPGGLYIVHNVSDLTTFKSNLSESRPDEPPFPIVVSFLKIKFQNHVASLVFARSNRMQDFLIDHYVNRDLPIRHETALVGAN